MLSKDLSACPRCGAGVRADAPWCTQCFLSLRQAPVPVAPAVPVQAPAPVALVPAPVPSGVDPLTAPLHAVVGDPLLAPGAGAPAEAPADATVERTWPCAACGSANGFDLDACNACGQGFLASLAGGGGSLVLPVVGDLATMSKAKRMGVAFGAVLALMLLVLVVGLLVS